MLYIAGLSIAFFLSFLLLFKKNKSSADTILAVWLLVIGVHLVLYYLFLSEKIYSYPWLLGVQFPFPLLHGPFLFLYSAALTNRLPASRALNILHFVPALICYIYLIPFFISPAEQKIFVFRHKGIGHETFMYVNTAAIILLGFGYAAWTNILLRRHRRLLAHQFSYTEKINLDWLQYLTYGIIVIWITVLIKNSELTFGTVVLFVLFIGFFGIRQVGVFSPVKKERNDIAGGYREQKENFTSLPANALAFEDLSEASSDTESPKKKYSKSGLNDETAEQLYRKLIQVIEREKIFTKSQLTLAQLASRLNTHPNYLSQIINEKEQKNFYDYINALRIQEFIKVISQPANQKFTLLSLAYDCGFNSKSSFNKYFKKATGQSPSEFLKQLQPESV